MEVRADANGDDRGRSIILYDCIYIIVSHDLISLFLKAVINPKGLLEVVVVVVGWWCW